MNENEKSTELPDSLGDYGGGISAKRIHLETTRLLERAIRERWVIDEQHRAPIVQRQVTTATDSEASNREATSAARCLVGMESQNLDVLFKLLDKQSPDLVDVQHSSEKRQSIEELQGEDDYLDYLRQRNIETDCDAGLVCQIAEPRNGQPLENGEAPGPPRPGANGHRDGSK